MIQLPDGFQAATLFSEFFHLAAPFAGIAMLIACGFLITRLLRKTP
jgi:hypothetical protein